MHFQVPPHAHSKLVYCVHGAVHDVVLDLRKDSPTFGQSAGMELSAENRHIVLIPVGFAHGFRSLTAGSCMIYKTDAVYAPDHDTGIRWDSFGYAWGIEAPLLSERDAAFAAFHDFTSPF